MKVAFVYDAVYPWVKGGAEMRIYELAKRLVNRGDEVHLFGVKWWEGANILEHEGMTLHGVCGARELYVNGRRSVSEALVFSGKLLPHLLKERFDLLDVSVFPYFSCFPAKAVSVLKKTPLVFTWHEVWGEYWYEYLGKLGFFGKLVEKAVSSFSDNNIAVSAWTGKRLEALGVQRDRIEVVPNGIDLVKIAGVKADVRSFSEKPDGMGPEELKSTGIEPGGIEPGQKVYDIIFAGRLIKEKNVDVLLKAVALLKADFPMLRCCIVGDGPEKETLLQLAEASGILENVEFAGFVAFEEMIGKLKASKVFVLPSSREGFGMVVIEAFASGVPVITVSEKYNAAQSLVRDGTDGFVVGLDLGEISEKVRKVLEGPAAEVLSKAALQSAKEYDWDKIFVQLLSVYEKASSRKK